jgi:predicted Ser/Thr protein kinase
MAWCASCGLELANGVRFCSSCGAPVAGVHGHTPAANSDDMATIDFPTATSPLPPSPKTPARSPSRPPSGSPSRTPSSRTSSSSEYLLNEGRFLPGRLIAGRYRIIALLGKGGMGEVYRADDLTLGQAVAMKFLPDEATSNEGLLDRFHNEVRMARRVSHPNVCRVYDVGEVDGQTFYTMEYVDGEDLSSLLRRIGRLPQDKAVEIARQLCAGLAAAHTKGVLHRDLKPANIMLDGRGQAVIMDFGLAGIADDIRGQEVRSGTPAYMSPEQIEGTEVTMRSDIYALGLVLYEVFTGKRAFAEKTAEKMAGALHGHADRTPSRPSSVVKDLDPIVEKIILRCLETLPASRPATALAVAAALPGGDPLAAALAAGETPSPQLVAASGETTGLKPPIAVACLVAVLIGLAVGTYMSIRFSGIEKMHLEQTPEVLAQKAREIVARVGYADKPVDRAFGFNYDSDLQNTIEKEKNPNWEEVLTGRPSVLQFWYRQSPDLFSPSDYHDFVLIPGIVTEESPPTTLSGMVNVKLDPRGRLIYFQAIAPQKSATVAQLSAPDWSALFAAAELDASKLQPAQPEWTSLGAADTRIAWTGVWPGSTRPLRVEAAAWQGKPVFFALFGDWNKPWRMVNPVTVEQQKDKTSLTLGLLLIISLFVAGAFLARRNYRHGRGDRDGAFRLGMFMLVLEVTLWACWSHITVDFQTLGYLMLAIASGLLWAAAMWMLYLALEPWIRRNWPQAIISWSRLISGQLRDPLVGRDILFGVGFGVLWILIFEFGFILLARVGATPQLNATAYLLGARHGLGRILWQVPFSIFATMQFFFVLLGLKVVIDFFFRLAHIKFARTDWLAAPFFVAILVGMRSLQLSHPSIEIPVFAMIFILLAVIVLRFGLVTLAVGAFTVDMFLNVPFTADFSEWYAPATAFALVILIALAGWGFYHSLGGEPVWKVEMD